MPPSDATFDPYKELQVDPAADNEIIQAAYTKLAKRFHPDGSEPDAEKMTRLNQARDVLLNPKTRAEYDAQRKTSHAGSAQPATRAVSSQQVPKPHEGLRAPALWVIAGVIALIGGAAAVVVASGAFQKGSGGPSLESYFKDYEKIDNKAENDTADLQREYDAALSATTLNDEVRTDLQDYYNRQIDIREKYIDDIAKLDPPDQARTAHDASISTYRVVLDAFKGIVDDIGQAQSINDLDAIFTGADLTAAVEAANKACADLQQVADDNNINVNLECE